MNCARTGLLPFRAPICAGVYVLNKVVAVLRVAVTAEPSAPARMLSSAAMYCLARM